MNSRRIIPAGLSSTSVSSERDPGHGRALSALLLLLALAACQTLPQRSGGDIIAAIDAELDRLEDQCLTGQILILSADKTWLARPLGRLHPDHPEPVTMDSVMPLASVSKPFTASALLALAADTRLSLNDPLGQHLEGLSADWHDLPLHHLLTHTAGLSAEIFNPAWPGPPRFEPIDRDALLRRVNRFPPDDPPGAVFNYSNVGYNLIAAVIESVSGQSFEDFLHQRLLQSAGITDIGLLQQDWEEQDLVSGRDAEQISGHYLQQARLEDGLGWHSRGSGDLLARPGGIAAWWRSLRAGTWLPQPWMAMFLTPWVEQPDGSRYGYGLDFRDGPLGIEIGHTGSDLDFTIAWTWFPDHDLMIYVALADSRWRADQISDRLARSLRPHLPP